MITEIVEIEVKPGEEAAFEAAVAQAIPVFRRSKGCRPFMPPCCISELKRRAEKCGFWRENAKKRGAMKSVKYVSLFGLCS